MSSFSAKNISRHYGVSPAGLVATVVLFTISAALCIWFGNRIDAAENNRPCATVKATAIDKSLQPVSVPAAMSSKTSVELSRTAVAPDSEKKASVVEETEKIKEAPSPAPQKKKAAPASRKKQTAKPARKSSIEIETGRREASTPSRLVTPAELKHRADTGLPENVEKVEASSLRGGAIPWYSVRTGYTDSKVRADILCDVLIGQGFHAAETVAEDDGTFFVSVGRYKFRYEAEDAAKEVGLSINLDARIHEKTVAE